ncbi:unnamed protein product [Absidia cylindrospora]
MVFLGSLPCFDFTPFNPAIYTMKNKLPSNNIAPSTVPKYQFHSSSLLPCTNFYFFFCYTLRSLTSFVFSLRHPFIYIKHKTKQKKTKNHSHNASHIILSLFTIHVKKM